MKFIATAALGCALSAGLAGGAQAAMVAALVGGDTLAHVDTDARKVVKTVKVSGLSGPLLGIDVRPADGMLYGVVADGTVVTIDPMSGRATRKSTLETTLPGGVLATVDFNPVADRLRIIGSDGTNLRANVDDGKVVTDGKLKYGQGAAQGGMPTVVAGAYVNSVKGARETTLYDIDATSLSLVRQAPPNDGVLNVIGPLGMAIAGPVAFDIVAGEGGANSAWLMAGDTLYSVDLTTGRATMAMKIAGAQNVRDIAILPAKAM